MGALGQECRLLGGLTAYELGDWDGAARRLDLAGDRPPAGATHLHRRPPCSCTPVAGEPVDPDLLEAMRGSGGPSTACASC